jgi:reverse gyrase
MHTYECPRCGRLHQTEVLSKRLQCGDCLMEHAEIVEMVLADNDEAMREVFTRNFEREFPK